MARGQRGMGGTHPGYAVELWSSWSIEIFKKNQGRMSEIQNFNEAKQEGCTERCSASLDSPLHPPTPPPPQTSFGRRNLGPSYNALNTGQRPGQPLVVVVAFNSSPPLLGTQHVHAPNPIVQLDLGSRIYETRSA